MAAIEYNLNVRKALNGWIVSLHPGYPGAMATEQFVVTTDEELGGAIAAMLVSGRLDGPAAKATEDSAKERYRLMTQQQQYEQMKAMYTNRPLSGILNSGSTTSAIGTGISGINTI